MEDQSVQNPIQEPIITPVPVLPPTKNNNFPVVVFAVLTLLLLVSTAFLYYQNQQLKNMVANYQTQTIVSPTPTSSATASEAADPTANWKTYVGNDYTFKYPKNFDVSYGQVGGADIQYASSEGRPLRFMGIKNAEQSGLKTILDNIYNTEIGNTYKPENFVGIYTRLIDIVLSGLKARMFEDPKPFEGPRPIENSYC